MNKSGVLLRQSFKHGHYSLAHVAMKVLELAGHVRKGSKAIGVEVFVL